MYYVRSPIQKNPWYYKTYKRKANKKARNNNNNDNNSNKKVFNFEYQLAPLSPDMLAAK